MSSKYGHMVHEYYVNRFRQVSDDRIAELDALQTAEDAVALVEDTKRKVLAGFGELPERTPLNAEKTGEIVKDGFRVEKIIFESRPGIHVTSNLYVPDGDGPFPAVLGLCGHAADGKGEEAYQSFCQSLVLKGFMVLIIDPYAQGERLQYTRVNDGDNIVNGICTKEHNMAGKHLLLSGDFFGVWRAWDGIRGLDYLLSRSDVDTSRVGVTGNSGGGTMTTWINALEDRVTMAAPSCFITTNLVNLENELPADSEQNVPCCAGDGLEMWDFIIARAPRPTIILAKKNDFFDHRGSITTYEQCLKVYRLLGAEDNIKLYIGEGDHGYDQCNREAMYGFFCDKAGVDADGIEPELEMLSKEQLFCTPTGQVLELENEKSLGEAAIELAEKMCQQRAPISDDELKEQVAWMLNCGDVSSVPHYRMLRIDPIDREDGSQVLINKFAVETEPGIQCVLRYPSEAPQFYTNVANCDCEKALLHIPHWSYDEEYAAGEVPISDDDTMVFGLDVRGTGDSKPLTCNDNDYYTIYGFDYFYAALGLMLNEPYLGRKVHDVLSAVALLRDSGFKDVALSGRGMGAIVAAFAALLDGNFSSVFLHKLPHSFEDVIKNQVNVFPQSHMPRGFLEFADLPDVFKALGDSLKTVDYADANFEPVMTH
jgi:dienelactone hydrolase